MGLKITRSANRTSPRRTSLASLNTLGRDLSSLLSARHIYTAATSHHRERTVASILHEVHPDRDGHLDPKSTGALFKRVWGLVAGKRGVDVVLDMSNVRSVASRFLRELAFLRKHMGRQNRRVLLCDVRPECSYLLDIN